MAFEEGLSWISGIFNNTEIFGVSWMLGLIVVFATMVLITRDATKWPMLAFPTTILWSIPGLEFERIWWGVSAISFVLWAITSTGVGNIISGVTRRATEGSRIMDRARIHNREVIAKRKIANRGLLREQLRIGGKMVKQRKNVQTERLISKLNKQKVGIPNIYDYEELERRAKEKARKAKGKLEEWVPNR